MSAWSKMTVEDVNLEALAQVIREVGRPVPVNVLARAALRAQLDTEAGERHYAPGSQYRAEETVLFNGQHATVRSVQVASNPAQGHFCALTLVLPNGTERLVAAGVSGAPTEDRQPVTDAQVEEVLRTHRAEAHRTIQAALAAAAPRFVTCQTLQGDLWCLTEMIPLVSQTDLRKALALLPQELVGEELVSCATEELVKAAWGLEDDGSDVYALHAFALSPLLNEHEAVHNLGDRWASVQAWEEFTARQALGVPRMPTQVTLPDGIKAATEAQVEQEQKGEAVDEGEEPKAEEPADADLETWRLDRPTYAVLTLRARHYYEGWLPLSKKVQQLFPPLASGRQEVVFHHHFGDEPESFHARVDREERRIWVSPEMYGTFRRHRIYPGARLRISARSEREYDIATRETDKTSPIHVWRMWLDEDGQIQYDDHEEPRRYDMDDDVYVADVRFEDREALLRQAEEVGNSIFGLMYQRAVEWWEELGRKDLVVTASQLYDAIHFDERGRMTSKTTIVWELWRRLAFNSVGEGRCLFRPEFGGEVRSARTIGRRQKPPSRKAHLEVEISLYVPQRHVLPVSEETPSKTAKKQVLELLKSKRQIVQIKSVRSGSIFQAGDYLVWLRYSKFHKKHGYYWFGIPENHFEAIRNMGKSIYVLLLCGHPQRTLVIPSELLESIGITSAPVGKNGEWHLLVYPSDRRFELVIGTGTGERKRIDVATYLNSYPFERDPAFQAENQLPPKSLTTSPPNPERTRTDATSTPEPIPQVGAFFIFFQQRPDSDYADRVGVIYKWRQGIPGSKQITEDARFIYYHPGEQVFFGTGRVASIETYVADDGRTYYDGHIADYEPWDPPLPLTPGLALRLSFVKPGQLGIGQAGIRKISREDFESILNALRQMIETEPESVSPTEPVSEFWAEITCLDGQQLRTLGRGAVFDVLGVDDKAVRIKVASSGQTYAIYRRELESVWEALKQRGELRQTAISDELGYPNPTYAAAILAALPDVTYQTKPIRLKYQPPSAEPPTPAPPDPTIEQIQTPIAPEEPVTEFWTQVADLEGRRLHTLDEQRPFCVHKVGDNILHVLVGSSGKTRLIRRQEIETAWGHLAREGSITRKEIHQQYSEFNPPYISAILAAMPGVTHRTGPIRLFYGQEAEPDAGPEFPATEETSEVPPVERRRDRQILMPGMPMGPLFDTQPSTQTPMPKEPPREPVPESQAPVPSSPTEPPLAGPPSVATPRTRSRMDQMQAKPLFSRHYLETRLPDHREWADDPRAAFEAVRTLWRTARQYGDKWNEAQTEEGFVKPVLEALGWTYTVQPKASSGGRITWPDYALFENSQVKAEADHYLGQDDPFYSRARAIAEAKYWGRPLSQKDASGRNTWKVGSNPSHQMVSYLVGTRVPWGILTNGRTWRLYSREVSSTASEFYEADLGLIFDDLPHDVEPSPTQLDQFRRWWLFFRRDAFTPDAQGKSFVQRVHEGSAIYAREISDKLKELIFEQVVPEISGGFVAYRYHQRGIHQETPESLREIYQATLNLLYKLLFLLYAEARSLLPVNNSIYREQSLTALAQWAAERLDKKLVLSDAVHATPKYDALLALFHRIDQGDPSLGIPRYNGGLFNPTSPENRFLEEHKLSDRTTAHAVDVLVRDAGQPVDYAYISVRNLGAIYEGLLENKLRVVDAASGQVELVNDKGERKASGSYYTPDYIVEYIVQHTLEPILDERQARFEADMDRCADLRRQLQRTSDKMTISLLRNQLDEAERAAREAFLGIKVCDPAMGSGHFLVNAVDHLTDGIIQMMQTYHDDHPDVPWNWNPIQRLIERVRGEILTDMERQGIAMDLDRLDDTALLTRLVMKRCIYGVDLNPLAVELAKLSLWLHSFTVGAPLSFLDHHLRWGNSLIGSDVRTVEAAMKETQTGEFAQIGRVSQFALFAGPFAGLLDLTALMTEVAEQADATLADVQRSAEIFEQFQKELTPYKQVLDLWVSQHFGNETARDFLTLYGDDVLPALRGERQVGEPYQKAVKQALALWREKRFFHWDLEFPEVFVDLRKRDWAESPGFDAVVGNPPWGATVEPSDKRFVEQSYEVGSDSYAIFTRLALLRVREGGNCSYIVPDTFLRKDDLVELRRCILTENSVRQLVETGPLFREVRDTWSAIFVIQKALSPPSHQIAHKQLSRFIVSPEERLEFFAQERWSRSTEMPQSWWTSRPRFVIGYKILMEEQNIIAKIERQSFPLAQVPGFSISRGEEGSKYAIQAESKGNFWMLFPEHIERYGVSTGVPVSKSDLTPGKVVGFYTHPKIWVIRIQKLRWEHRLIATPDYRSNSAGMKTLQVIVSSAQGQLDLAFMCSLLCSTLFNFWCVNYLSDDMNQSYLEKLPIRRIDFTTPGHERQRYAVEGQRLYEQFCAKGDFANVRRFVTHHLEGDRSDVVHDLLTYLAEQMIAMHKEKQGHQRAFRLDLAGYLDEKQLRKINRLYTPKRPPKEGIKNYDKRLTAYEQAVALAQAQLGSLVSETLALDDFWRLNQAQWMWLLRQRLGKVADMSEVVAVHEQYRAQLTPLMRRIQRTDWLIDQVVYQLYGLTEEEIAVVEGR